MIEPESDLLGRFVVHPEVFVALFDREFEGHEAANELMMACLQSDRYKLISIPDLRSVVAAEVGRSLSLSAEIVASMVNRIDRVLRILFERLVIEEDENLMTDDELFGTLELRFAPNIEMYDIDFVVLARRHSCTILVSRRSSELRFLRLREIDSALSVVRLDQLHL